MNYLSVEKLTKRFADKTILDEVTFGIDKGQKTALVGLNGTGKTTLFNILIGKEGFEGGNFSFNKQIKVRLLPQDPRITDHQSILDYVLSGDDELSKTVREYELAITTGQKDIDSLVNRMDELEAWSFEATARQILGKLGIHDLTAEADTLSGGQQKRVALAKLLIENPDFLLLDEPTNHLDLEIIEWLEQFLAKQKTSLLLVTHDRYFLEAVTNDIIELDRGKIYRYNGNYSYFLEKKLARERNEVKEIEKARNLMRQELDWIRRQPKARGTKAKYRIEAFDDIKKTASKRLENNEVNIALSGQRLGKKILEVDGLAKSFGDLEVIKKFSYTFKKADRIGIIGKNGSGKSTLIKLLTSEMRPDAGSIKVGETVVFGYYKQEGLAYRADHKVIDEVTAVAEYLTLSDGSTVSASQLLNQFNFSPKKQYDFVEKLSGGEKRRLQLLKVLIKNPNFLILDEPTNDLDLQTLNTLEDYLESYGGCLVVVSHDRYFLDRLADHLFVLDGSGHIKDFPGNFSDYRNTAKPEVGREVKEPVKETAEKVRKEKKKLSYNEQREYDALEGEIAALEGEKASINQDLLNVTDDYEKLATLGKRLETVEAVIEEKEMRWLELSEKVG